MDDTMLSTVAKALAHPARLRIVRLLASQNDCRGAELFSDLPLAQSTISQHLAVLKEAGIVHSHSSGQASVYCLDPDVLNAFCAEISAVVASSPMCPADTKECL